LEVGQAAVALTRKAEQQMAAGGIGVSSNEDETAPLLVETPLPGTSPPTQNKTATTHTLDVEMDSAARAATATRMPAPSELGNGEGKVARVVEVPQPPPNKHSVDGDDIVVAPAHRTPQPPPSLVSGDGNAKSKKKRRKSGKSGAARKKAARNGS